ncbi:MAG: ASCH domain-containing protein [Butyrivibrio sp.]|nr:ASCH domain-containing protein [Butyrivibrio sp.]
MKAISLTQPYAELIKNGTKKVETRSWKTDYRGIVYIHASATKVSKESKENTELMKLAGNGAMDFGKIICSCNLVDCVKMTDDYVENMKNNNHNEFVAGVYSAGRYAWIFEDIKALDEPFEMKGHLGLWNFEFSPR